MRHRREVEAGEGSQDAPARPLRRDRDPVERRERVERVPLRPGRVRLRNVEAREGVETVGAALGLKLGQVERRERVQAVLLVKPVGLSLGFDSSLSFVSAPLVPVGILRKVERGEGVEDVALALVGLVEGKFRKVERRERPEVVPLGHAGILRHAEKDPPQKLLEHSRKSTSFVSVISHSSQDALKSFNF